MFKNYSNTGVDKNSGILGRCRKSFHRRCYSVVMYIKPLQFLLFSESPSAESDVPALVCWDLCIPVDGFSPFIQWTDSFRSFSGTVVAPSAAPALFELPPIFQDVECLGVYCGDKKEIKLVIELFLLNKLNF